MASVKRVRRGDCVATGGERFIVIAAVGKTSARVRNAEGHVRTYWLTDLARCGRQ